MTVNRGLGESGGKINIGGTPPPRVFSQRVRNVLKGRQLRRNVWGKSIARVRNTMRIQDMLRVCHAIFPSGRRRFQPTWR
jgi:hypothetical protein